MEKEEGKEHPIPKLKSVVKPIIEKPPGKEERPKRNPDLKRGKSEISNGKELEKWLKMPSLKQTIQ